ncbi:dockerin-like protein [Acetivibrio clariflavus DSM 19732]|uniref:Dockerin-like protein n=2 Tax=Acetivibrio clariflavus TaxID=288965 RepID=G8LW77_ACECE|nr:dockerin-like protein [Acetivibrio clariflavus DSM 19732]
MADVIYESFEELPMDGQVLTIEDENTTSISEELTGNEKDNSEEITDTSVQDSVYTPKEIQNEFIDELPVEPIIPSYIKMFSEFPEDKPLIGDVDGNGDVNSIDYAFMKMYLLGIINDFNVEDDLWASDVNGDGVFNSIDYAFMKLFLLGRIKEFPKQNLIETPTPVPTEMTIGTPTPTENVR